MSRFKERIKYPTSLEPSVYLSAIPILLSYFVCMTIYNMVIFPLPGTKVFLEYMGNVYGKCWLMRIRLLLHLHVCMSHTYTHTDIATHTLGSGIKTVLPDWQHCKLDVYN